MLIQWKLQFMNSWSINLQVVIRYCTSVNIQLISWINLTSKYMKIDIFNQYLWNCRIWFFSCMFQSFAEKQKVNDTFCVFISNSNKYIDQKFIQRLLSGYIILLLMSPSFFGFFQSSFIGRNNIRYGHIGMDAVINIVSAAEGLVVLWIMKMFTCFLKKCHISQWSRLISIVCNKYTYQYLQCHMLMFYHRKIYSCQATSVLSFLLHAD